MLNIVSLPKYIDEIRIILADQYFDVLALNEARLDKNISNQDMFVQNYDLIRADRSRSGEGVCLYVKNSINYLNRNDLVGDNLEAICIEVLKPSSAFFIVGTIYRPPGAFVDSFSNIEQLVKLIDDKNKEFYLLGDLNANMLDNSNNTTKHLNAIISIDTNNKLAHSRNDDLIFFIRRLYCASLLDVCNSYARKISYIQSGAYCHKRPLFDFNHS